MRLTIVLISFVLIVGLCVSCNQTSSDNQPSTNTRPRINIVGGRTRITPSSYVMVTIGNEKFTLKDITDDPSFNNYLDNFISSKQIEIWAKMKKVKTTDDELKKEIAKIQKSFGKDEKEQKEQWDKYLAGQGLTQDDVDKLISNKLIMDKLIQSKVPPLTEEDLIKAWKDNKSSWQSMTANTLNIPPDKVNQIVYEQAKAIIKDNLIAQKSEGLAPEVMKEVKDYFEGKVVYNFLSPEQQKVKAEMLAKAKQIQEEFKAKNAAQQQPQTQPQSNEKEQKTDAKPNEKPASEAKSEAKPSHK